MDENDLLATNTFISMPDLDTTFNVSENNQFKEFYLKQLEIQENLPKNITEIILPEPPNETPRKLRVVKTFVNIDSRDRNKIIYSKPNHFKIYLGKNFYNVESVRLASVEFPNTNAVINSTNNIISWRNQEDITLDNTVTTNGVIGYPVYSATLNVGSYIANTLQTEIETQLNLIRRNDLSFHYFVADLNISTDIVTFIGLRLKQLPNNPFGVTSGSGVIVVNAPNHGFSTNDQVYIVGSYATSGIDADLLNGFHIITVINTSTFTFQVNVNAAQTVSGGGNVISVGRQAPFQLLWGSGLGTVAQNLGYPLENSSQLVQLVINEMENIFEMVITLTEPGIFSVGDTVILGSFVGPTFVSYRAFVVFSATASSVTVQVGNTSEIIDLANNSQATHLRGITGLPIEVASFTEYFQQVFLVTTNTPHGYNYLDTITILNSQDPTVENDISYDGNYQILQVPSSTTLVLPGVLYNTTVHASGVYGNIPVPNPLVTLTIPIETITPEYLPGYVLVETSVEHTLLVGDTVYFNNTITSPQLTKQTITTIIDDFSFLIKVTLTFAETSSSAFLGTGIMTMYLPGHGFNQIIGLTNSFNGNVRVQTAVPHGLDTTIGTTVKGSLRISGTGIIDGFYDDIIYISADTFEIYSAAFPTVLATGANAGSTVTTTDPLGKTVAITTTLGTTITTKTYIVSANTTTITTDNEITNLSLPILVSGTIGLDANFYLYGVASDTLDIGGIRVSDINSSQFSVREVLTVDRFTFVVSDSFATKIDTGGGTSVFISSLLHGFTGVQTNTKNSSLNRSINLQGENYAFLTCPQLDTMKNTGTVTDIFARFSLDQPPGYVCFNFLSQPKVWNDTPLNSLSELEFQVVNWDSTLYEFNDMDFSFSLEITEIVDTTPMFNQSSRRGI